MSRPGYVPHIDGLRAVAVLSVIAYHLNNHWLPGGFTGVDVFFVISGFVVSGSVGGLERMSVLRFLAYFYSRRLFRIAPALLVCLMITSLAFVLLVPSAWLSMTAQKTGQAAFYGFSNFVLARTSNDYFSPFVDYNPFTHSWSLAVEEQFYLIFPALFLPWIGRRRRLAVALVAAGFFASLLWARHLAAVDPGRSFYMISSRFWELATGVLLYQALALLQAGPLPRWVATLGSAIAAALLAAGLMVVAPATTPYPGGALPVLGAAGILLFLHDGARGGPVLALLDLGVMRYIGRISYSLYLWHWPVFVLFRWTCGLETVVAETAALALTFGAATASYHYIETPPRRALQQWRGPRYAAVAAALAVVFIAYQLNALTWSLQPQISLSTVTQHKNDWYPDSKVSDAADPACRADVKFITLNGGFLEAVSRSHCAAPATFRRRIFVIGDSHALAYSEMMRQFVLDTGTKAFLYGVPGCSFMNLRDGPMPQCTSQEAADISDVLSRLQPGDIVFLAALRLPRIVDQYVIYGPAAAQAAALGPASAALRQAAAAAAVPILKQFAAKGAVIVFEGPTPLFGSVTFRCADWYDRANAICAGGSSIPRALIESWRAPILAIYQSLQTQIPNTHVWDPLPLLCPGRNCSEYRNGRPLFFDGDHLSGYANQFLLPDFSRFVFALGK